MSVRAPALGQRRMMLLVVLIGAVFVLFFPARQLVDQRRQIDSLEARLVELKSENARLDRHAKRLQDPAELEVLARERLGLVRPGERAYFIEPVEQQRKSRPKTPEQPSLLERGWEWLGSVVRGGDRS